MLGRFLFQFLFFAIPLSAPYLVVWATGYRRSHGSYGGRLGMAMVFFLATVGHFALAKGMMEMIPPQIPYRYEITLISGVMEFLIGLAIVLNVSPRAMGYLVIAFMILVFPLNVYSAIARVSFGGHDMGPVYLLFRMPLQLFFIGWTYYFFLRRP